jgi:predicted nucleic acid-binding protein
MSDAVADSSVMAKWVLPEPDSPQAEQFGTGVIQSGGRLIALDSAFGEVANALWVQFHRKRLTAAEVAAQYGLFLNRPLNVAPARPLVSKAIDLATRYDIAVYDALFVALTADLGVPGVTSDEPLYRAVHADHPQIHLLRNWPPPTP